MSFEVADHLDNARAVITGQKKTPTLADIVQLKDYYSFGMVSRSFSADKYRFGNYNGKEMDEETGWQNYGYRNYNPVIGRFDRVDDLASAYSFLSPYAYAENQPIWATDLDGLETLVMHLKPKSSFNGISIVDNDFLLYEVTFKIHESPNGKILKSGSDLNLYLFEIKSMQEGKINGKNKGPNAMVKGKMYKSYLDTYSRHTNWKVFRTNIAGGSVLFHRAASSKTGKGQWLQGCKAFANIGSSKVENGIFKSGDAMGVNSEEAINLVSDYFEKLIENEELTDTKFMYFKVDGASNMNSNKNIHTTNDQLNKLLTGLGERIRNQAIQRNIATAISTGTFRPIKPTNNSPNINYSQTYDSGKVVK